MCCVILLLAMSFSCALGGENDTDIQARLVNWVYSRLRPEVRPVHDPFGPVRVDVDVQLRQILQIHEQQEWIKLKIVENYFWDMPSVTWDLDDYDGLDHVIFSNPEDHLWDTDIILQYQIAKPVILSVEGKISYQGRVTLSYAKIVSLYIDINIVNYPFDTQTIKLHYISSVNPVPHLVMTPIKKTYLYSAVSHPVWAVQSETVTAYNISRNERVVVNYSTFEIDLVVARESQYPVFVIVIPSVMLALLELILIETTNPSDRKQIGLSMFLSYFMLLMLLVSIVSGTLPKIGLFIVINMFLTLIIIFISPILEMSVDRAERGKVMGHVMRKILLQPQRDKTDKDLVTNNINQTHVQDQSDLDNSTSTEPTDLLQKIVELLEKFDREKSEEKKSQVFSSYNTDDWKRFTNVVTKVTYLLYCVANSGIIIYSILA